MTKISHYLRVLIVSDSFTNFSLRMLIFLLRFNNKAFTTNDRVLEPKVLYHQFNSNFECF